MSAFLPTESLASGLTVMTVRAPDRSMAEGVARTAETMRQLTAASRPTRGMVLAESRKAHADALAKALAHGKLAKTSDSPTIRWNERIAYEAALAILHSADQKRVRAEVDAVQVHALGCPCCAGARGND